ncbi:MAG: hypothetical protein AAF959_11360 [Cyanobacteria bacterium P01_D01_bin.56]
MNSQVVTSIASYLNVSPNQIKSVTELAWVWSVVVHGCRARFVSKKIKMVEKTLSIIEIEKLGTRWQKHGKDRIYFEQELIRKLLGLSNSKFRQLGGSKFFYDVEAQEFVWQRTSAVHGVEGWAEEIKERCTVAVSPASEEKCCSNCGSTHNLMAGSLGLLCPACYDDVEGDL